ncbi:MAG: MBL fold metallo-hydrolase [bacterium]
MKKATASLLVFILCCGVAHSGQAPFITSKRTPSRPPTAPALDEPLTPQKIEPSPSPQEEQLAPHPAPTDGVQMQWFGHSFIYLISSSGLRVAIDPFGEEIKLPFPNDLHADVVLIAYESEDRQGGERLGGAPQVFRGITGVGENRACGLIFRGVETFRNPSPEKNWGVNTAYVFELDGVRFCHLGGIGSPLNDEQVKEIGSADVLFAPIGNKQITTKEFWKMAQQLQAKWIVPIAYYNPQAGFDALRPLEECIEEFKIVQNCEAKEAEGNAFVFRKESLPSQPTLLLLKLPQ